MSDDNDTVQADEGPKTARQRYDWRKAIMRMGGWADEVAERKLMPILCLAYSMDDQGELISYILTDETLWHHAPELLRTLADKIEARQRGEEDGMDVFIKKP